MSLINVRTLKKLEEMPNEWTCRQSDLEALIGPR